MGDGAMCELLVDDHSELRHLSGAEDLFSILETWEECVNGAGGGGGSSAAAMPAYSQSSTGGSESAGAVEGARPTANSRRRAGDEENGVGRGAPVHKKQKGSSTAAAAAAQQDAAADEGAAKMSHIAVERNRRKQMNEHLAVLRSLMPCFYIKRVRFLACYLLDRSTTCAFGLSMHLLHYYFLFMFSELDICAN